MTTRAPIPCRLLLGLWMAGLPHLSGAPPVALLHPRLSPDGRQVAVSFQGHLAVLPAQGGALRVLTHETGYDIEPAWTPDGERIVFVRTPQFDAGTLQVIRVSDGTIQPPPGNVRARGSLHVLPDGRRVVGFLTPNGWPSRPALCDLVTGEVTPLSLPEADLGRAVLTPAWDGEMLWLATHQDLRGEQDGMNGPSATLWEVSLDGTPPRRRLAWPARIYAMTAGPKALCLVTDLGASHNDLWQLDPEANESRRLTHGLADEDRPSYSRRSDALLFTDNRYGIPALTVQDSDHDDPRTVKVDMIDWGEPTGRLKLRCLDAMTGLPLSARGSLRREGGGFYGPPDQPYWVIGVEGSFYLDGPLSMELPAGSYQLTVRHGFEHFEERLDLMVEAGATREVTVAMSRWIDMPERGWYSGENHIHANYGYGEWYLGPDRVRPMIEGEDLNVANIMVANSDGDGVFDREWFRGYPDLASSSRHLLYWNEEFRSTLWGHMTLIGLSHLVEPIYTGFKDTSQPYDVPTNLDVARKAHWQEASVSYTHPAGNAEDPYQGAYAAKGLPVDAALGEIDTLDVMGFGYGPTLGVWYRLLNCGFRLPAAAGTDCFLNRVRVMPPGWGRCYVHLPGGLDYRDWMEGQRAGRSFITMGPMLEFSVDQHPVGDTLELAGPREVRVQARAMFSPRALDALELVHNGQVIARSHGTQDPHAVVIDTTVRIEQAGWLAVRTGPPGAPAPGYREGEPRGPVAHSNPVYVDIKGQDAGSREDALYFLAWIDRLEAEMDRRGRVPQPELDRVRAQLESAREIYRRMTDVDR